MDDTKLSIITKHMHYGCDEAGRGCLNGPVVVASVLLGHADIPALNDSKKLTEKSRNKLFDEIMEKADDVSVVEFHFFRETTYILFSSRIHSANECR